MDLSIVIVNWNAKDILHKCLAQVQDTTREIDYEVIVVDNASTDGSQAMVKQEFPSTRLIENSANVGFAGANNQGMALSQGRYVLLLNSDAFVGDSTLDTMVGFMDEHPEAGVGACKLRYGDGRLQPSCYTFPSLLTELYIALQLNKLLAKNREFGKYAMTWWDFNEVRDVDCVMGAFMLVRREVIEQAGMMDTSFFMFSEEVDWCYRIKQQGWQILYNPAVESVHLWGGSTKQVSHDMFLELHRSKVHFFRKYYGRLSTVLLKVILGFGCLLRIGPGLVYYLRSSDAGKRQKYQDFRDLLRAIPAF